MSLTPEQLEDARHFAIESAEAQGLPPTIEDPSTLAKVLTLIQTNDKSAGPARVPAPT